MSGWRSSYKPPPPPPPPILRKVPSTSTGEGKKRKRGERDGAECKSCGGALSESVPFRGYSWLKKEVTLEEEEEKKWLLGFCVETKIGKFCSFYHVECYNNHEDCNMCEEERNFYVDCSPLQSVSQGEIDKLCQKIKKRDLAKKESDELHKERYFAPLSSSLSSQPPLFYVDGVVSPPPSSLRLFYVYKGGEEGKGKAKYCDLPFETKERRDTVMKRLMKAGSTASFGRDGESVTDTSYRNAKCLASPSFSLTWSPPSSLLSLIETALLGGRNGKKLRCELYKLNVYGEGGLFRSHVDTPSSESMFGSLVVCLPVEFQGGELLVRKRKHEVRKKWGKGKETDEEEGGKEIRKGNIQWIAFYGDCEHEILPVKSGFRVTVTYRLYGDGDYVVPSPSPSTSSSSSTSSTTPQFIPSPLPSNKFTLLMREYLADPLFLSDGGKIGIHTLHAYPHTSKAAQPLLSSSPHLILKGLDALIFSFFHGFLSLETDILPIYTEFPGKSGVVVGASFQPVSNDSYYSDPDGAPSGYTSKLNLKEENEMIFWLNVPKSGTQEIGEITPTYGNEPSIGIVYSHCAFLITVPPFFDPVRAALMEGN